MKTDSVFLALWKSSIRRCNWHRWKSKSTNAKKLTGLLDNQRILLWFTLILWGSSLCLEKNWGLSVKTRWHNKDLCSSVFRSLHENAQNEKISISVYPLRHYWEYMRAEIRKNNHWEPRYEWKLKPIGGTGAMESCWWLKNKFKNRDEGRPGSLIFHRRNREYSERKEGM